jgi:predicted flap endonuclease-1-like 5' DNA nuclease/energy-coupling factor transporter ATP-binding protein EcfA2
MKLTGIAIDGYRKLSNIRLMQISPSMNLVYGEKGTGKTRVADFICGILFGQSNDVHNVEGSPAFNAGELINGTLNVSNGYQQYALARDGHGGNRLNISNISGVSSQASSSDAAAFNGSTDSQALITGSLDLDLFNSFFNVSFDTRTTTALNPTNKNLAAALHRRLGVPIGPEHSGESAPSDQQIQAANALRSEIESVNRTIAALQHQSQQLNKQISSTSAASARASQLDQQIAELERRIVALTTKSNDHEIAMVNSEIEQLKIQINAAQPTFIAPATPAVNPSAAVYEQLDEIDTQLNRWRSVQNDVQQQRVVLKDEMIQWNEMTLESEQHPYHDARRILLNLEKRVDNAQSQTGQWLDSHGPTDSYQAAGFVDEVCNGMRDDLYVLCDELGKQYKQIRHRSAAAELKRLRRCYEEITENVTRLIQRRRSVLQQLRTVDAAGADVIERSDKDYSQFAAQEGHLRARERFLGRISVPAATPQRVAPDLSAQRNRLLTLENRRAELLRYQSPNTLEMTQLESQVMNLRNERASLTAVDNSQSKIELARVQRELQSAMAVLQTLNLRLDEAAKVTQVTPNALLIDAAQILSRLSHGELTRLWLTRNGDQTELQVQDRQQRCLSLSGLSPTMRTQTQLSLILAANEMLLTQGVSSPLIIDELFEEFDTDRIDTALQTLSEFSARGHQVLMLTQHRFLIDRANNFATIEFFNIQSQTAEETYPPVIQTEYIPAAAATPPATIAFSTASTFSANGASHAAPVHNRVSAIAVPTTHLSSNATIRRAEPTMEHSRPAPSSSVTSIKANQIGDRLQYAVAVEEHSPLDGLANFDSLQLRTLNESGIVSVADLLNVDLENLPLNWHEVGLTRTVIDTMQSEVWLLSCVPALRPHDAHVLVACGIFEPDQLETSAAQSLFERVQRYLSANENENEFDGAYRITLERINDWHKGIGKTRKRWRNRRSGRVGSSRTSSSRISSNRTDRDGRSGYSRTDAQRDTRSRRFDDGPDHDHDRDQSRSRDRSQRRASVDSNSRSPRLRRYQENGTSSSEADSSESNGSGREFEGRDRDRDRERNRDHDRGYDRSRDRADNIIRADRSSARSRDTRDSQGPRTPRMVTPTPDTFRRSVPALAPEAARIVDGPQQQKRPAKPAATRATPQTTKVDAKLKFYLDLEDHIEAAPSIGPKTAERFEKIGVFTIADFLKQTAESMASKLNYKRMSADIVRSWQHQARLVCRIPNLRGHDAQLLVACDLIEPEEIASMRPQSLFNVMGPFSETKQGLKIIRSGKKPDLAEITDWIAWAQHTRSLQAA